MAAEKYTFESCLGDQGWNCSVNYNTTSNGNDSMALNRFHMDDPTLKYIILISYLATFMFGLIGNVLVIYIIAHFVKVRNKSVANYYIWNLAFADLLYILALPLFCYNTYTNHWPFGNVCCKIAYLLRDINKFASVFTLVALSMDRYLATFHRMAYLRTIQVGKVICVAIWILCCIVSTPYLMFANTVVRTGGTQCKLVWPKQHMRIYMQFWTYFQFAVGLLIPFVLICMSYFLLVRRFRSLVKLQAKSRIKRSGKKMTQTIIAVVVTFLVCQTPYHGVNIANVYKSTQYGPQNGYPSPQAIRTFTYINGLAQILVFISSCSNPIIYALLNENFRKLYSIVLCRCRRGRMNVEEFGDLEVDGQYIPISLKIQVTFHLPCKNSVSRSKTRHRSSIEGDTGTEPCVQATTSL